MLSEVEKKSLMQFQSCQCILDKVQFPKLSALVRFPVRCQHLMMFQCQSKLHVAMAVSTLHAGTNNRTI